MARFRRVVTGHSGDTDTVVIDGPVTNVMQSGLPGLALYTVWGSDATPTVPDATGDAAADLAELFPGPGGNRFVIATYPPGAGVTPFKPPERTSGMVSNVDIDESMMHMTDTVDYGIVVRGELWMDLGTGEEVHLRPGDVIVQQGVMHAWRNRGTEECVIAFVIVGATRTT